MLNGIRVIDTHCHIYPAKIAAKAIAGTGKFYNVELTALDGTPETLRTENEKAGIDLSLVCSVATTAKQVGSINRYIASVAEADPEHICGLGTLYPGSETPEQDVEEGIALGLRGFKLHPDIQGYHVDDERCMRLFAACEGRVPVLLHTGDSRYDFSNPNRLCRVLDRFPGLTVIAAHFGAYTVWQRAEELGGRDNLCVDCSSSLYYLRPERARDLIRFFGSDRVLFGTDYPMWYPAGELERLVSLELEREDMENILHRTAERVFGV